MLSLDDRRKLIKYLNEHKNELENVHQDFKTAITELETENVQTVLTKKRLKEMLNILILFMKSIKAIESEFEEE